MIYIETLDGVKYDLKEIGLIPLSFIIDSPTPLHMFEEVEGRNGFIDLGTTYSGRTMRVNFLMKAIDFYDYSLLRSKVFDIFQTKKYFYLVNTEEYAKRWKVKVSDTFTPERLTTKDSNFEIEFISSSPFSESIGTTTDPFLFTVELWQIGQGLTDEMTEVRTEPATWFDIGQKKWSELYG